MLIVDNETNTTLETDLLESIHAHLSDQEVELLFVDDVRIQELNLEHRGKNKATDVLSFPLEPTPYAPLGTIVISVDTAKRIAEELGHTINHEIALLFIHGMLHLLGMDHEVDTGEMRDKEAQLIAHFNLPKSLILRTEA